MPERSSIRPRPTRAKRATAIGGEEGFVELERLRSYVGLLVQRDGASIPAAVSSCRLACQLAKCFGGATAHRGLNRGVRKVPHTTAHCQSLAARRDGA